MTAPAQAEKLRQKLLRCQALPQERRVLGHGLGNQQMRRSDRAVPQKCRQGVGAAHRLPHLRVHFFITSAEILAELKKIYTSILLFSENVIE